MNREIKFRAWDGEKMHYLQGEMFWLISSNGYFELQDHGFENFEKAKSINGHRDLSIVDNCGDSNTILMQSSGLCDKNGKDVYDGDIVNVTNKGIYNGNKVVVWDEILLRYVLVWAECFNDWKGTQNGTTFIKASSGVKCEIVGNIYENAGLLNLKKLQTT